MRPDDSASPPTIDEAYLAIRREMALSSLGTTLALAEVRCLGWHALRPRLRRLWEDPQAEEVVYRIKELQLSVADAQELADELRDLTRAADGLRSRERAWLDRKILRLTRVLPGPMARVFAVADLDHPRKLRRLGAYESLRVVGVDGDLALRLLERFESTGDEEALQLIARSAEAIEAVDVTLVLGHLRDAYWRMRVVECLLRRGDPRVVALADEHSEEFVHAVGRLGTTQYVSRVQELVLAQPDNLSLLSLGVWALGKLGDAAGLERLRALIGRHHPDAPFLACVQPRVLQRGVGSLAGSTEYAGPERHAGGLTYIRQDLFDTQLSLGEPRSQAEPVARGEG